MTLSMLTTRLRHRGVWLFALLVAAALMLSACDLVGNDSEDDEQEQSQQAQAQQEQEAAAPAATPTPAARPADEDDAPEPPPAAQGGGEGATAYSIVFPSLALVMTADGAATGLVLSDGYVLVDERSLGGATTANVLLSNGETLEALPIIGRDQFTGLAYLGPVDATLVRLLPGARLGNGEGIRPGSSVFTIGHTATDGPGSLPSVYSGVLSGFDEWEAGDLTFLRTDARPPHSIAGMVLVDGSGTVIGVTPASMVVLGLYISTADLARGLPPTVASAARGPNPATASTEHVVTVDSSPGSGELFIGDDATGQTVSLSISTMTPATLTLFDADGAVLQESDVIAGSTIISLAPRTVGPYRLVFTPQQAMMDDEGEDEDTAESAEMIDEDPVYEVSSSAPLMAMSEADAMMALDLNAPFVGTIDIPGDADSFNLPVRAGAVYEVTVQSLLIDSVLLVEGGGLDAVNDDTGGGPFGRDSALTLAPVEDAIISLTVKDYADDATGPYILTITQVAGDMPDDDSAMGQDGAMVMVSLPNPAAPPAVSLRGIGGDAGLQPTLLGLNSQSDGNGLIVEDADGAFEIIVSVIGSDGAHGRLTVTDADGAVVVEGRILVSCVGANECLARAIFVANESVAGEWVVELSSDGPEISEWQIEVERRD